MRVKSIQTNSPLLDYMHILLWISLFLHFWENLQILAQKPTLIFDSHLVNTSFCIFTRVFELESHDGSHFSRGKKTTELAGSQSIKKIIIKVLLRLKVILMIFKRRGQIHHLLLFRWLKKLWQFIFIWKKGRVKNTDSHVLKIFCTYFPLS